MRSGCPSKVSSPGLSLHTHRVLPAGLLSTRYFPGKWQDKTFAVGGILDSYRQQKGIAVPEDTRTGFVTTLTSADEISSSSDDDGCPVECVREIFTEEEFKQVLETTPSSVLIVVDFYRTACGACKYIQPGFVKLCKGSVDSNVVFLKHNVMDEYEEETDLAHSLQIKAVPTFFFYKGGELIDKFPTRERRRIALAIDKYAPDSIEI